MEVPRFVTRETRTEFERAGMPIEALYVALDLLADKLKAPNDDGTGYVETFRLMGTYNITFGGEIYSVLARTRFAIEDKIRELYPEIPIKLVENATMSYMVLRKLAVPQGLGRRYHVAK